MKIRIEETVLEKVVWKEKRCLVSVVINGRLHCINMKCICEGQTE